MAFDPKICPECGEHGVFDGAMYCPECEDWLRGMELEREADAEADMMDDLEEGP